MMLVRTDANASMGVGHAMRCLALAEAWIESGGRATLATAEMPSSIRGAFARGGAEVRDVDGLSDEIALAKAIDASCGVVDGYHLGPEHHAAFASLGARVLVVDDCGESASPSAAVVLNQNPHASESMYAQLGSSPKLLLGPRFALLRSEFRSAPRPRDAAEHPLRVLVSFGGADPHDLTPYVLDALSGLDLELHVLVGAANPRADQLRARASDRVRIEVASTEVALRMQWADVAVVAAGSTCWELARFGVPSLAVVTADNQRPVGAAVEALGIGVLLGELADLTRERISSTLLRVAGDHAARARMSAAGPEVIDGQGAFRVCAALREERISS